VVTLLDGEGVGEGLDVAEVEGVGVDAVYSLLCTRTAKLAISLVICV
jgi:hypothetical protein